MLHVDSAQAVRVLGDPGNLFAPVMIARVGRSCRNRGLIHFPLPAILMSAQSCNGCSTRREVHRNCVWCCLRNWSWFCRFSSSFVLVSIVTGEARKERQGSSMIRILTIGSGGGWNSKKEGRGQKGLERWVARGVCSPPTDTPSSRRSEWKCGGRSGFENEDEGGRVKR